MLTQTFTLPSTAPVYSVASMKESTREIILKSVNPTSSAVTANIMLKGVPVIAPTSQKIILTSNSPSDENSLDLPNNVVPVTSNLGTASTQFTLGLPAYSATILRVQTLPAAPANLTAMAGNQQTVISWNASAGAASYSVKRATSGSGPFTVIASGLTDPNFTDTGLANGNSYYYLVAAVNSAGETAAASAVAVTPALPSIASFELVNWYNGRLQL